MSGTGRPPRPVADDRVSHAINRGNDRAAVFLGPDDHLAFLEALSRTRSRDPFDLVGDCLKTNHVHLLLRPAAGRSISHILRSLTVAQAENGVNFWMKTRIDTISPRL